MLSTFRQNFKHTFTQYFSTLTYSVSITWYLTTHTYTSTFTRASNFYKMVHGFQKFYMVLKLYYIICKLLYENWNFETLAYDLMEWANWNSSATDTHRRTQTDRKGENERGFQYACMGHFTHLLNLPISKRKCSAALLLLAWCNYVQQCFLLVMGFCSFLFGYSRGPRYHWIGFKIDYWI